MIFCHDYGADGIRLRFGVVFIVVHSIGDMVGYVDHAAKKDTSNFPNAKVNVHMHHIHSPFHDWQHVSDNHK